MRIEQAHIDAMIRHAQGEAPNEACGVLEGAQGIVERVHPLENADHSPYTYALSADGYRTVIRLDEEDRLLAVFHSHTHTPAYPSPTDRRKALWSIRYVLISLADGARPVVRVFRIAKQDPLDMDELGQVTEEGLEVVDGTDDTRASAAL